MFGLVTPEYSPAADEMELLEMMSTKKQKEILALLDITAECLRWRTSQLRLNLGVETNWQLMCHYGIYKERNKK